MTCMLFHNLLKNIKMLFFYCIGPSCRHIRKGTDQTLIKKLSAVSDWTRCQECKHEDNKENISTTKSEESEEETVPLWMCLKCGHRGCGRDSENQHAIKHYETPRSDPHSCFLSVNTEESEDNENKDGSSRRKKNIKKENTVKPQNHNAPEESCSVPVKGLSNLGNTCFFNAVLQNLSQTQLLRQILNKVTEEKMSLDIKPDASLNLEPILVQLDQPGSLTLAMCKLLNEIQESKRGVVTPRELFTQVCKKAARFKGFQQQDSQELLRYLLDGMRAEELKVCILKQSSKVTDEEKIKAAVKEYEKNGVPKNFVDQLFGGEMTSTIMCQECKTVSVVTEMFLDLSLPVSDEVKRMFSLDHELIFVLEMFSLACLCVCDNLLQAYRKKNPKKVFPRTSESSQDERNGSDLINAEDTENADHMPHEEDSLNEHEPKPVCESEQDQNVEQENEEDKDSPTDDGSLAESSVSNRFIVLSEEQHLHDSASCNKTSNTDLEGELDTQLANQLEQVTLNDAFIEDLDSMDPAVESEDEVEYTIINQDPEFAFNTLSTRTSPEKQECSVQSCLFQFTEVETLTQNNSLLCVACTKRHKKGSKKNIYTDALKQMLISSPPSVLTLHMKRFQQNGYSICKVNRHVQFPLILDLAPYCSAKCKNIYEGDTQILYSLYGVVEHSGTMRSGHYTAYVKARPDSLKSSSNEQIISENRSWFHISDTSVQPVSESKVQSCQAYLLFYERIL
uniref:Ubiquitin carboxyl-terminal hydrolase n=1 Tax=Xiphophorus couchianus TaxID=32473 RepID=A0A3B5LH10_9TELE